MARKKSENEMGQITFRCPADIVDGLKDLAHLSRRDVTDLLVELCTSLVKANKDRLTKFRQQAGQPIKMPSFDTVKKKNVPPMTNHSDSVTDKGANQHEED